MPIPIEEFAVFVAIGFAAQLVDGALGMAYGLICTSVLLGAGLSPAMASASVHTAEIFTTGVSGFSHWRLGNVDSALFWKLAIPGVSGGVIGAIALVAIPAEIAKLFVSIYLIFMGVLILFKALRSRQSMSVKINNIWPVGLVGGGLDAIGGGGWGATVTSTLIGWGINPRHAVGTSNAVEFFVATTIAGTFVATIGLSQWPVIAGLVVGGVVAAPFAAYVTRLVPTKSLMLLVGAIVVLVSLMDLYRAFRALVAP
jgi:uncharacterized protein